MQLDSDRSRHLVLVDTAQIQPYIFGSNRLREHVGASFLVAQATGTWALAAVPEPNNVRDGARLELHDSADEQYWIEKNPRLKAEVLYAGGGNAIVRCRDEDVAERFTRALSRRVLAEAPGLRLFITRCPFEIGQKHLSDAMDAAFEQLAREKQSAAAPAPLLGLSVTRWCFSTGLPAKRLTNKTEGGDLDQLRPASAEILAKRAPQARGDADARLHAHLLNDLLSESDDYTFPAELDDLGRTHGAQSYMAVVHADGDGMAHWFKRVGEVYGHDDRLYAEKVRAFSNGVRAAATGALRDALRALLGSIRSEQGERVIHGAPHIAPVHLSRDENGRWMLPFRPLVFGGDDVTFACDGRLGLALVRAYQEAFETRTKQMLQGDEFKDLLKQAEQKGEERLTASAGVAIVKTHYPFARAYGLAEELSGNAKAFRKEKHSTDAFLDWHIAATGLSGDLDEIRRREYTVVDEKANEDRLELHPVAASGHYAENELRSWNVVRAGIKQFQNAPWAQRRNKIKMLREVLRSGNTAVKEFVEAYYKDEGLPEVYAGIPGLNFEGWRNDRCAYFDALELVDLFIPLTPDDDEADPEGHAQE